MDDLIQQLNDPLEHWGVPLGAIQLMRKAAEELKAQADTVIGCTVAASILNEQSERLWLELSDKNAEITQLRKLISSGMSIMSNCDVTTGVCCCGDNMASHADPMSCGHAPTDSGDWTACLWQEEARHILEGHDHDKT